MLGEFLLPALVVLRHTVVVALGKGLGIESAVFGFRFE